MVNEKQDLNVDFNFDAAMLAAAIPEGSPSTSGSSVPKAAAPAVSFAEGYVPIPVETVLKPACHVSRALSFGDLYSSLVCVEHKNDLTSVYVSTGQAFFASKEKYVEGVADFKVYIQVQALLKAMSLASTHIGFSEKSLSLGFWDLFVPINAVTDSDDLRKHFAPAEAEYDFDFLGVDFPFGSLPADILGLYSAALVTLQNEGIVWYSSENKHFVSAAFPYNVALHLTTVKVLRTQQFKKVFLKSEPDKGDKLFLKTDTFTVCVPTFKIEQDLFKTTFSIPVLQDYSPCAPVPIGTMMKSADLFSGSVKFKITNDGTKSSISAIGEDKVLFSVPLLLGDANTHFDFTATADAVFDIQSIISIGQDFLSAASGVCVFFKN